MTVSADVTARDLRAGRRPGGAAGTRPPGRPQPGSRSAERLTAMAAAFVRLFLEIEAGRRPRSQLAPLMTPLLFARLGDVWVSGAALATVVSVRLAGRTRDTCDVVALVRRGPRHTAVALRLVRRRHGGWLVSDIARPEHGALPPPPFPIRDDVEDAPEDLPRVVGRHARTAPDTPPDRPDWFPMAERG